MCPEAGSGSQRRPEGNHTSLEDSVPIPASWDEPQDTRAGRPIVLCPPFSAEKGTVPGMSSEEPPPTLGPCKMVLTPLLPSSWGGRQTPFLLVLATDLETASSAKPGMSDPGTQGEQALLCPLGVSIQQKRQMTDAQPPPPRPWHSAASGASGAPRGHPIQGALLP